MVTGKVRYPGTCQHFECVLHVCRNGWWHLCHLLPQAKIKSKGKKKLCVILVARPWSFEIFGWYLAGL